MRIPFLDLRRQLEEIGAEADEALRRVLRGGAYILGPEVEAFEEEWARFCGARFAAGVGNGTDALALALLASGAVRPGAGDEVVTTPLTAAYTALAILNAGAVPVFADVDPRTLTLSTRRASTPPSRRARAPSSPSTSTARWPTSTASTKSPRAAASSSSKTRAQAHGASYARQTRGRTRRRRGLQLLPDEEPRRLRRRRRRHLGRRSTRRTRQDPATGRTPRRARRRSGRHELAPRRSAGRRPPRQTRAPRRLEPTPPPHRRRSTAQPSTAPPSTRPTSATPTRTSTTSTSSATPNANASADTSPPAASRR